MEAAELVLDQVQVLDREIRLAGAVPQQFAQVAKGVRIDLPAFRRVARFTSAGTGGDAAPRIARRVCPVDSVLASADPPAGASKVACIHTVP